jgi:hypothetical protein
MDPKDELTIDTVPLSERYFAEPVRALGEFLWDTERVLALSTFAIRQLTGFGRLAEALRTGRAALKQKDPDDVEQQISFAKGTEKLAIDEVRDGFPLLISHSVVAIWSALEAMIPKFVVQWLLMNPDVLKSEPFERIKLPVSVYQSLDREGFVSEVVQEVMQATQSALKPGIGRFEVLLEKVGLGGAVPEIMRRDLFELSQVRNLIVHQFAHVDARFAAACPWMQGTQGTRLRLTNEDFDRYRDAIRGYVKIIIERVRSAAGSHAEQKPP